MATPDNGLAAQLYTAGVVTARVGKGQKISIAAATHYPFEEQVALTVRVRGKVTFPLYLRVPEWCKGFKVTVNDKKVVYSGAGSYVKLSGTWKDGDKIVVELPMELRLRKWERNKNSVSVNYGPLGFSLKIAERYEQRSSKETAQGDARWQEHADAGKWPSYEIFPASDWNYGLVLDSGVNSFVVKKKDWPADDNPFTDAAAPIVILAKGRQIPGWKVDQYGLCGVLPQSPVHTDAPVVELTLVPMGGARLRISAFPVVERAGGEGSSQGEMSGEGTFMNPLLPSGADPYSFYKDGYYYYTHTMGGRLDLWKTKDITDLRHAERKTIFTPPPGTLYSKELWAPEVLFLEGKWYAYFAADGGHNKNHRLYVLENASEDPFQGEWVFKGKLADASDKWAIDGDVFRYKHQLYLLWSGWEGDINGTQNIYIAKMKNPWEIEGERVLISSPNHGWEKIGDLKGETPPHIDVNEGPQALIHGDDLFVVYSASACWTDNYALGLLRFSGGSNLLNPDAWKKSSSPVFQQSKENQVYAPGHNSFFLSPDGKENWILYHANSKPGQGCGRERSPRAQPFTWDADGTPVFGEPVSENKVLQKPSR